MKDFVELYKKKVEEFDAQETLISMFLIAGTGLIGVSVVCSAAVRIVKAIFENIAVMTQ